MTIHPLLINGRGMARGTAQEHGKPLDQAEAGRFLERPEAGRIELNMDAPAAHPRSCGRRKECVRSRELQDVELHAFLETRPLSLFL